MRWRGLALRAISEGVALLRAPFGLRHGLRILAYHAIGSSAHGDRLGLNSVAPELFQMHLDLLSELSINPLSPLEMPQDELQIAITFDDGYADNLHVAAPLLVERGIPFTVFVTSDFVRGCERGFLSPAELQQLASAPGVTIGAHGRSHRKLTQCGKEELRAELEDSKTYLEDLIGQPVATLAYPHGATDQRVRDAAQRAGYEIGACSHFDINCAGHDPLMLSRCVILRDDSARVVQQKLRGDWDWYRWRSIAPLGRKMLKA